MTSATGLLLSLSRCHSRKKAASAIARVMSTQAACRRLSAPSPGRCWRQADLNVNTSNTNIVALPKSVQGLRLMGDYIYIEAAHAARIRQARKGERRSSFATGRHGRCLRRPVAVNDTQVGLRTDARRSSKRVNMLYAQ
jgi:hypothetical protein